MNQLIKPATFDINKLVIDNNMQLNNVNTKMIKILKDELTEDEYRWFIANLYIYINYDLKTDFPINLETAVKILGFAHKKNAKRTLENNFTEGEDYKILVLPTEQQVKTNGGAGLNKEEIMLNIDTFKNLAMLVKTPEGKAVRRYYVKMESISNKVIKEEIEEKDNLIKENQRLLEENKIVLQETQDQLQKITKLSTKKWYSQEPGHTIYALTTNKNDCQSLVTIGKSRNIAKRESSYMTCNQNSEMFYIRKCFNCDLAEKVIHHILDKHREESNKEWFSISKELSIYTIDMVCDFLDNFINSSEKLVITDMNKYLSDTKKLICTIDDTTNSKSISNTTDTDTDTDMIKDTATNKKKTKINDITKFIEECCIIDKDARCITFELLGAYRIWLRGCSLDSRKQLTQYMKNNYESIPILYEEYDQTELLTYIGIKPKSYIVLQEDINILPKYEQFVLSECKYGYTYRMRWTEFLESYTKWSGEILTTEEKVNLEAYINRHFFKYKINMTGHKNVPGIWGLQLKTDNSYKVGTNKSNRKQIVKINIETNEVIEKYIGLVFASRKLNIDNRKLSSDIISKKIFDIDGIKYMYKYVN